MDAAALRGLVLAACAALGACSLPERGPRAVLYDFGPGAAAAAASQPATRLPPLALAEIETNAVLDGTAMLYRLGYADAQQLRPYAQTRWSAAPAQLVRQRLREHLAQRRPVLNAGEGAALSRSAGETPPILRLELDEFAQHFTAPAQSVGRIRVRATLVRSTPGGEQLVAQRSFTAERPAPSADASGGVRALAGATDALALELAQWLEQPN